MDVAKAAVAANVIAAWRFALLSAAMATAQTAFLAALDASVNCASLAA